MEPWDPDFRDLRPDMCCANCAHWHKLTDKTKSFGVWSDKDTLIDAMPRGTERATLIAKRLCGNLGICGYWVDSAEAKGEEEPNYLTAWDEEPGDPSACDFIAREDDQ